MSGKPSSDPVPTQLVVHQKSRLLEIHFDDGREFSLPFELLRVYSPSAEVRGHGPGQETLQVGKRHVGIVAVESIGHYAILPRFDDGHDSGIFSWDYLYWLGDQQAVLWDDYLARLEAAGASRDPRPDAIAAASTRAAARVAAPGQDAAAADSLQARSISRDRR
ncbi:MAG: DUF971 domain-containing protein [Burkholderiaceae bacterium]